MSAAAPAPPIRILLIGEEHIRSKVARHYQELEDSCGIETHFFVDDRSGITRALEGLARVRVRFTADPSRGPAAVLRYWRDFVRYFREVRPDILEVYTSINFLVLFPMMLYAAMRGVPRVVVCRGELYQFDRKDTRARFQLVRVLRMASLIVYKELYMRDILEKECPGVPRMEWTNAIPVREEPDYARAEDRVLFLNFFKAWRNADVLVRAAPLVREKVPGVRFDLVGGTDALAERSAFYAELHAYEQQLRALVAELGVEDCVRIHPFTTDVEPWFASAKAYLLPADLVFCNYALLEAMERGVPPVVSADRDPDARRIVEDGRSGRVVAIDPAALAEAVVEMLTDEPLRQRLARGAREKVASDFNLARLQGALVERYAQLARPGDPPRRVSPRPDPVRPAPERAVSGL